MAMLGDNTYGDDHADVYDMLFEGRDDLNAVSQTLASLANGGPVLEFGIGTGRLALPLARLGLTVCGIDNSTKMLDKLRAKPGSERIATILGDCVEVRAEGNFSLVFFAFSSLFNLASQDAQVRCFQNAARHLDIGGKFLVESFVHDRSRWHYAQEVVPIYLDDNSVGIRVAQLDPVTQVISMRRMELSPQGIKFLPNRLRFVYPPEMDLMGRLAGFKLNERWSDWKRSPFTADSGSQIAVYEKIADHAV
jgi:SAM-dependent methyltransferase